ncbi:glycosyltransferase family 2 protein [Halomonas organivorans]|uniref:Glycosyltransferase 2-like domain-containing protein n=1 Tax=Halomonas organivorans TaxID=257772 RepID=A0A7W5C0M3_9GAMM|nr:hypothetical protein [Halomonas organivorans]
MGIEQLAQSPWFDADWYLNQYAEVATSDLAPEVHYLQVGEPRGWRPGPSFDPRWYLAQYPDLAKADISPLLHFISHGEQEGRLPCALEAVRLDRALWGQHGQVDECLSSLVALLTDGSLLEASYAGFSLGRWHAWQGDWQAAASCLARRPEGKGCLPKHAGPALLTVEAFGRSGQFAEAWRRLASLHRHAPGLADTSLAVANLLGWQAEAYPEAGADRQGEWQRQRLTWINDVWQRHGLAQIELADPMVGLNLDNLVGLGQGQHHRALAGAERPEDLRSYRSSRLTPHQREARSPLLTVIVPAYNAEEGLPTALRSLAEQRGVKLEVIVVDDASSDQTARVAEAFAGQDARFKVFRQPSNQGAYAARNRGLAEARGDYITVHDSDDWSHPEKLAIQLAGLQAHPEWMACCSHWVRCTPELIFSNWRMEEGWIYRNVSSLMFRRGVFEALGYWDRVRVEADTEYYYRIRAAYGDQAVGEVMPRVPLAFGRTAPDSLTAVGATHLVTQFSGVRADYRQSSQAWHRAGAGRPERLYLPAEPAQRTFAAPEAVLP